MHDFVVIKGLLGEEIQDAAMIPWSVDRRASHCDEEGAALVASRGWA